jgi:hypothetical protein
MAKKKDNNIKAILVITKKKKNAKGGTSFGRYKQLKLEDNGVAASTDKTGITGFTSTGKTINSSSINQTNNSVSFSDGSNKNAKKRKLDPKGGPNFGLKKVIIKLEDKDATDSSGQTDNSGSDSDGNDKISKGGNGTDSQLMNIDVFAQMVSTKSIQANKS